MPRMTRVLLLTVILVVSSACTVPRLLIRPCTNPAAPQLATPRFQSAEVGRVTVPPDITEKERAASVKRSDYLFGYEVKADEIVPTSMNLAFKEQPVFNGGPWPAVRLDVDFKQMDFSQGAFIPLNILAILYFPGGWLIGLPTGGACVRQEITYAATVESFKREYTYSAERCGIAGLYYRTPMPNSLTGYTYEALAKDLAQDYEQFTKGALPATPPPVSRDVSDEGTWSPRKICKPYTKTVLKKEK